MEITIISSDKRYAYLNESLNRLGYNSKIADINDKIDTDIIIMSVRKEYSDKEYEGLLKNSSYKKILSPKYIEKAIDYTDNEAFLKKNAYLTAEGAICLYYNEIKETLLNKSVLILGYGRIAKYLAKMLRALNCRVSIYARRQEVREEIILDGYTYTELGIGNYDIVFNTIPQKVVKMGMYKNSCRIELANGFESREDVINGNGIPGRMFPKSASNIILEAILPYIN